MTRPNTDDYRRLFLEDLPLMDVRAPVEFDRGAFPSSVNIPLLDNNQRADVGTRYKEQGQDAAIALGWQIATPEIKAARQAAWLAHAQAHPSGFLYCFRGGLRSRLSQQLLKEAGLDYPLVVGGYKAMRRFLIDELETNTAIAPLVLVSGRTGSGKTLLLSHLQRQLDLEALANHRGSAFGRQVDDQPSQIDFENQVSIGLMKLLNWNHKQAVFVEDEGKLIGRISLPLNLKARMQQSPLAILETPIDERIDIALADYVTEAWPKYLAFFDQDAALAEQAFRAQVLDNLSRIRKRLGGDKFDLLFSQFSAALALFFRTGDTDGFRPGIETLLVDYYDPMYDYQKGLRQGREIFRGPAKEYIEWANEFIQLENHPLLNS
ncbi:tRNA 2-selenouridine(34) synthase MnmH [Simiduia curdlanivorans]|uniref:tRNA 2-selenouridine synthase n=1 Tax=Simiduia curdlanivorans TaxID=1492769 RepID=A0ABV8V5W0_9GAMM|nr:tRNA 2-selenouridine(34) synthase MnmH [Simiduia curdlanivorans]MDN3638175.1 tRNA 2-selenouridine(34) synthase MnmH [Simiduia curdlanivorans]